MLIMGIFGFGVAYGMIYIGGKARKEGRGSEDVHPFVTAPSYNVIYYWGWANALFICYWIIATIIEALFGVTLPLPWP